MVLDLRSGEKSTTEINLSCIWQQAFQRVHPQPLLKPAGWEGSSFTNLILSCVGLTHPQERRIPWSDTYRIRLSSFTREPRSCRVAGAVTHWGSSANPAPAEPARLPRHGLRRMTAAVWVTLWVTLATVVYLVYLHLVIQSVVSIQYSNKLCK